MSELVSVAKKRVDLSDTDGLHPILSRGLLGNSGLLSIETYGDTNDTDSNIPSSRKSSKDSTTGGSNNGSNNSGVQSQSQQITQGHGPPLAVLSVNDNIDQHPNIRPFPRMERRASII